VTKSEKPIEVVGDLVASERVQPNTENVALRSDRPSGGRYTYAEFARTARKTGNYLAHHHVEAGRPVGVAGDPRSPALLTLFGAALLGGAVQFEPPTRTAVACLVVPHDRLDEWRVDPGTARVAYGNRPEDPDVRQFGRVVSSENAGFPPTSVAPETAILPTGEGSISHSSLLETARACRETARIESGTAVVLRTSLEDPGAIAGGIIAPLLAGATVVLPGESTAGDIAVTGGDAPEGETIDPSAHRPALSG
jgi:non-ribosomal peptide synthetase component F